MSTVFDADTGWAGTLRAKLAYKKITERITRLPCFTDF